MIIRHLDVRGCALIASKKYYFGVGGGTGFLESLISHYNSRQRQPNDSHLMLVFECVCSHSDGSSNVREIIKITYNLV